ncbi:MAG: hypothetical protein HOE90_24725 [Bacteriovoracaceae bacterium]|nr:hypothetical protein [Bacteriovoracaceae bacterium]
MKAILILTLLTILVSCGKKTQENVDNMDQNTEKMASQMEAYQDMLQVYAEEMAIIREYFKITTGSIVDLKTAAVGVDGTMAEFLVMLRPMVELMTNIIEGAESGEVVEPKVDTDEVDPNDLEFDDWGDDE